MTTIQGSCPFCGTIQMIPRDITLYIRSVSIEDGSHYDFNCPKCKNFVSKPADLEVVALLQDTVKVVDIPEEVYESKPITRMMYDDLLDFMEDLKGCRRLVEQIEHEALPKQRDTNGVDTGLNADNNME